MKNNPYIGPRPYHRKDGDKFYGRNREARDLFAKIRAERVVLFYAQSGAGKSSLLNAKVIPALEDDGFYVLPVVRVGSEAPSTIDTENANIFMLSVLLNLAGETAPTEELPQHTLTSYLQKYYLAPYTTEAEDENDIPLEQAPLLLLIFDQFEELFTTHQDRWQQATGFFQQIDDALTAIPELGIVFAMREDYVAALDPYSHLLPRRMRARFRMERLGPKGALAAITKPALQAGCAYDKGVAERIVDNLRLIKMQRYAKDGTLEEVYIPGPHIEPVQLQVICNQLWENLPEQDDYAIQWEEVEKYGDIDRALNDFYERAVDIAVEQGGVTERQVRVWFNEQLITPMETRGLVLRGVEETTGLSNTAVDILERQYIIRAESRAGARWYEISHDRLVEPILNSNLVWTAERETPLRAAARRWQETNDKSLLFQGIALQKAQVWLESHPDEAEPFENNFIQASQLADVERVKTQRRRKNLMLFLAAGLIMMTWLVIFAFGQMQRADESAKIAQQKRVSGLAHTLWDNTGRGTIESTLLALHSLHQNFDLQGAQALARNVAVLAVPVSYIETYNKFTEIAFSPDGKWVATGGTNQEVHLWETKTGTVGPTLKHKGHIVDIAFSPNGQWLITGGKDKVAYIWDIKTATDMGQTSPNPIAKMDHEASVSLVAFSPDNHWAVSTHNSQIHIMDTRTWQVVAQIRNGEKTGEAPAEITALKFSANTHWLFTGHADGKVRVWDMANFSEITRLEHPTRRPVLDLAVSQDNTYLVSSGQDKNIMVWNIGTWEHITQFTYPQAVWAVDISADNRYIAAGGADNIVNVWDLESQQLTTQVTHAGIVGVVKFSPDGEWVASGGGDGLIRVWHTISGQEIARGFHESSIWDMDISADGRFLATASDDKTARVWDLQVRDTTWVEHPSDIWDVQYSPDGKWIASASDDGQVKVWDAKTGQQLSEFFHEEVLLYQDEGRVEITFGPFTTPQLIASASEYGQIALWEAETGKELKSFFHDKKTTVWETIFSPDGQWLISAGADHKVHVWDIVSGQKYYQLTHDKDVLAVDISIDGKWIVSGGADHSVRVWDTATGQEALRLYHDDDVWDVKISADGRWLASGSDDGTIRVWDLEIAFNTQDSTPDEIARMEFEGWMDKLVFSPDSQLLAFGAGEFSRWDAGKGEVQIWAYQDGAWTQNLQAPRNGWVRDVAFSRDNQWLVSGDYSGIVSIWDTQTGQEMARLHHLPRVYSVAFSPDGHTVASGGLDNLARKWIWYEPDLEVAACNNLTRNLSATAWDLYIGADVPYVAICPNLVE